MILLGALVAVWGAVVLGFAGRLHASWKGMLADMQRAGVRNTIPGTRFFASDAGLRRMRIAGGAALAVGLAFVVAGLVRGAGG
ncbi:MAG TPA: hypothetical protein VF912_15110 [Anaeromyxobacter sp.]